MENSYLMKIIEREKPFIFFSKLNIFLLWRLYYIMLVFLYYCYLSIYRKYICMNDQDHGEKYMIFIWTINKCTILKLLIIFLLSRFPTNKAFALIGTKLIKNLLIAVKNEKILLLINNFILFFCNFKWTRHFLGNIALAFEGVGG